MHSNELEGWLSSNNVTMDGRNVSLCITRFDLLVNVHEVRMPYMENCRTKGFCIKNMTTSCFQQLLGCSVLPWGSAVLCVVTLALT